MKIIPLSATIAQALAFGLGLTNALCARADTPAAAVLGTDIGLCAGIKNYLAPREQQQRIDRVKEAGLTFVRTDFVWRSIESRRGEYHFADYDTMMQAADRNGLAVLGLISHAPKWAVPVSDHVEEWLAFVEATVRRYPQVRHWEIYNEPNLAEFWVSKPDPAGYAKLFRLTAARIKAIDPRLFVLTGGLASSNDANGGYTGDYAEAMLTAGLGDAFDAFAIHPYRFPHAPEESVYAPNTKRPHKLTLEEVLARYRQLLDRHGLSSKPIWITECGYTSRPGRLLPDGSRADDSVNRGVSEADQANFLPRSILLAFQYGVSSWMWFTAVTAEKDPMDKEDWFGILHPAYAPRPAFFALKALRRAYPAGSALLRDQCLNGPVYRLAWRRPDGTTGWALWIAERETRRTINFRIRGRLAECFDAVGNKIELGKHDRVAQAMLSGRVLYLVGPTVVELLP